MLIEKSDLEELKRIYLKNYGATINNKQVEELGSRLINLFQIIAKPVPIIDKTKRKEKNVIRNNRNAK